jgi:tRNA(Ile)-lysidine synthase
MIIEKVRRTIVKYRMLNRGDKVVVGVSGGADSVALIRILHELKDEWNISLIISHLNHSFRGEESKKEAEFVKKLAAGLNLPFELRTVDVPALKKGSGKSDQEVAREVRYHSYEEIFKRHDANRIALGHSADDQAESVLMRLIRGAGPRGLSGIPPIRDSRYIRPLIEISRKEIEDYLEKKGAAFVNDSSNKKKVYLRNKIRLQLLPLLLGEYNPRFKENLLRLSSLIRQEDEYLEKVVEEISSKVLLRRGDDFIILDLLHFLTLHKSLQPRMLRKFLEALVGNLRGINYLHLQAVLDMLHRDAPNRSIDLPRGIRAIKNYNELILRAREEGPMPPFFYTVESPEAVVKLREACQMIKFTVLRNPLEIEWSNVPKNVAHFNLDKIQFPLLIRNFRKGDRFQPLGMKGFKKVKDYFIDEKIPLKKRGQIPLILSGEMIIWLIGLRIDDRVRVENATRNVLKAECVPMAG